MKPNNVWHGRGTISSEINVFEPKSEGGTVVAKFQVLCEDGRMVDGEWIKDNDLLWVTTFGKAAEKVIEKFDNGDEIEVVGQIKSKEVELPPRGDRPAMKTWVVEVRVPFAAQINVIFKKGQLRRRSALKD